ncbi:MAG TPA: type II secretion system F family protein [Acidimicrobiales bacterium]
MIAVLLMGTVAGGGLWLVVRGWWPAQPPLASTIEALGMAGRAAGGAAAGPDASWWHRVMRSAATSLGGDRIARRPSLVVDLALMERPPEAHAIDKLQTGLFGAALPVVLWAISSTGSALPAGLVGVSSIVLGVGGWLLADRQVAAKATRRRQEFRLVLATYLRLVTVLLAGGSGTEEALQDAASYGTGWGFSLLRRCVTDARLAGRSPWSVMQAVAERTALDDLAELAGAMTLAGEAGAQVRRSLDASAAALTERELADVDARAASRTERMNAPIALLVIGFVILVIFPGVYSVVNL